MPMIHIRMTGTRDNADTLLTILHGIDGIEHVEEIDDPFLENRDDSSSAELVDDNSGELFLIEVTARDALHAEAVRAVAEVEASVLGAVVEFTEDF